MSTLTTTGNWGLPSSGNWSITSTAGVTGNVYITPNNTGTWVNSPIYGVYNDPTEFRKPTQSTIFKMDEKFKKEETILISRFSDIVGDKFIFNPQIDGKELQPLETIMKLIKLKKKFDVELCRCGYNIVLKGVQFKNLTNILSKESDTTLKVEFEYDDMIYDNTLLSIQEKRGIKIKELMNKINDI
jgi:hypothetical protein